MTDKFNNNSVVETKASENVSSTGTTTNNLFSFNYGKIDIDKINEKCKQARSKEVLEGLDSEYKLITSIADSDLKNENANMNGNSPAGQMMKFASVASKDFALKYLIPQDISELHKKGVIHIHDLDYYSTKSATCVQYDLDELFAKGFWTRNGFIREPQSIGVYAELAAIVFQTAQNEMHGGQAIPAFDYFMAPGVNKSFIKALALNVYNYAFMKLDLEINKTDLKNAFKDINFDFNASQVDAKVEKAHNEVLQFVETISLAKFNKIVQLSVRQTKAETDQAMEGFVYNLNTQHSRGGNQVVFSSINLGTDDTEAGRQVTRSLLKALRNGLGNGETSIFPICIFKVKDGLNFSEEDVAKALSLPQDQWWAQKWNTPNFDLFLQGIQTTSERLFPNFMFLDTPYNFNPLWDPADPKRWRYEAVTMGCRTRTYENVHGEKTAIGRGNLSFTSLNLPFIALELLKEKDLMDKNVIKRDDVNNDVMKELFLSRIEKYSNIVAEQLLIRYNYQKEAYAKQFPFLAKNNVLKGAGDLDATDQMEDVLKNGSLTIGYVGLAEALKALIGVHHGEDDQAQEFGLEVLKLMNQVADKWKEKVNLNFSVIATPAESVAGRMAKITRKEFGEVKDITLRDYFTNSNHVPVYYDIKAIDKVKKEAAYHKYTLGGSISYIELDGEAKKNLHSVLGVIKAMHDNGTNYGSLNHPVDRCKACNYSSIIKSACPKCQCSDISRTRRITGYLVGDLDGWNSGKKAEEADRVKHGTGK